MIPEVLSRVQIARTLPAPDIDGGRSGEPARGSRYGEQYGLSSVPIEVLACDEGSLFVATLLPGATALQLGISAAFSPTAAALGFINSQSPGIDPIAQKRCYPRFIRMLVSGAPTSAVNWMFASILDNKDRSPTNLVDVGGAAATATAYTPRPFSTNMDLSPSPVGKPWFPLSTTNGAPPAIPGPGPNARTIVGNGQLRGQIPVVGDEYIIAFGNTDIPPGQLVTAAPAGMSRQVFHHPAIAIGPAQHFLLPMWGGSNATAGIIFSGMEICWLER